MGVSYFYLFKLFTSKSEIVDSPKFSFLTSPYKNENVFQKSFMIFIVAKNTLFGITLVLLNNYPDISLFILEFLSLALIYLLNKQKE
jgi:hypothetical protein